MSKLDVYQKTFAGFLMFFLVSIAVSEAVSPYLSAASLSNAVRLYAIKGQLVYDGGSAPAASYKESYSLEGASIENSGSTSGVTTTITSGGVSTSYTQSLPETEYDFKPNAKVGGSAKVKAVVRYIDGSTEVFENAPGLWSVVFAGMTYAVGNKIIYSVTYETDATVTYTGYPALNDPDYKPCVGVVFMVDVVGVDTEGKENGVGYVFGDAMINPASPSDKTVHITGPTIYASDLMADITALKVSLVISIQYEVFTTWSLSQGSKSVYFEARALSVSGPTLSIKQLITQDISPTGEITLGYYKGANWVLRLRSLPSGILPPRVYVVPSAENPKSGPWRITLVDGSPDFTYNFIATPTPYLKFKNTDVKLKVGDNVVLEPIPAETDCQI